MIRLVLASASPARLETLRRAGVRPTVMVSGLDEDATLAQAQKRAGRSLAPIDVPLILARAKAEAVAMTDQATGSLVLGCDSVLEFAGALHGKPSTKAAARERWHNLSGHSGTLHTGHWVIDTRSTVPERPGTAVGAVASTLVHFTDVSDKELEAYLTTGEPLHVAGAFTIDGLGGAFIEGIEGDPHNVIGISLPLLRRLLGTLGIPWHTLWSPEISGQ